MDSLKPYPILYERGAIVAGTDWLLLLTASNQAGEADDSVCERALAAATPQNVQVADGSPILISGQKRTDIDSILNPK